MVEPRKPRVIRTRPGTVPPSAADSDPSGTARSTTEAVDAGPAGVCSTSAKVSVEPVPVADKSASRNPVPAAGDAAGHDAGQTQERKWTLPRLPSLKRRTKSAVQVTTRSDTGRQSGITAESAGRNRDGNEQEREQEAKVLAFPVSGFRRRRRNVLWGLTGVVAVLALVMGMALFSPALAVQQVVFDGQKLVGGDVLQEAVAPILSKPLPQVTEGEVQDLLAPVIQVKSARIEAKPPSTLLVHIVERVPVALLKNDSDFLLVDQDGVELGSTKDPAKVALPLIDGGKAAIGKDTFRAITAVLANLPQPILAQLANASAKSPDAVELKLADGRTVIWGNPSDMELKAEVLGALLNAPAPTPEPGKPTAVPAKVFDVSAPRHPVTR